MATKTLTVTLTERERQAIALALTCLMMEDTQTLPFRQINSVRKKLKLAI